MINIGANECLVEKETGNASSRFFLRFFSGTFRMNAHFSDQLLKFFLSKMVSIIFFYRSFLVSKINTLTSETKICYRKNRIYDF